jgi:hypothetical protein
MKVRLGTLARSTWAIFLFSIIPAPASGDLRLCRQPAPDTLTGLGILLSEWARIAEPVVTECHRLSEGESAVVSWDALESPTHISHAYRLSRTGAKTYKTEIRLVLVPAPGDSPSATMITGLRSRITRCLAENAVDIPGPSGESLQIVLSDDEGVPATKIEVTTASIREDALHYSTRSICPTLLHEILHLHGLADEYREEVIGFEFDAKSGTYRYLKSGGDGGRAYDCRHLGPEDSPMRNQWAAAINSRPWDRWTYDVCVAGHLRQATCRGGKVEKRFIHWNPGEPFRAPPLPHDESYIPGSQRLAEKLRASRPSLLEPGHFLAITRPGCRDVNALYYACVQSAYVTAAVGTRGYGMPPLNLPGFPGPQTVDRCPPAPPQCRDPKAWASGSSL